MVKFARPISGVENDQSYMQGIIQVFHNNEWGTICNHYFDHHGAKVVCGMMGFPMGAYNDSYRQDYSTPSSRIWLDEVRCNGSESNIADCLDNSWGTHNCNHTEDVAIRCYGM